MDDDSFLVYENMTDIEQYDPCKDSLIFRIKTDDDDENITYKIINFIILTESMQYAHKRISIGPKSLLIKLVELNISYTVIHNIHALRHFINLEDLNLSHNKIQTLYPLSALRKLKKLNLCHNNITDISPLAVLTELRNLNISHNYIMDIDMIEHLTNLESVNLNSNRFFNIEPLKTLTNLNNLHLSYNNRIHEITTLSFLTNLVELDLSKNNIHDIKPLTPLCNLTLLNLAVNLIADISPLTYLTNLDSLNLHMNRFDLDDFRIWKEHANKKNAIQCEFPTLYDLAANTIVKEKIILPKEVPADIHNNFPLVDTCYGCKKISKAYITIFTSDLKIEKRFLCYNCHRKEKDFIILPPINIFD